MDIVEGIFSDQLFADLRAHGRKTKLVNTNLTQWNSSVVGWSSPIIQIPVKGALLTRVKQELRPRLDAKFFKMKWDASIHLGSRLSFIPWHNDANHKLNVTVYLHETWQPDHAGYFIYQCDEDNCLKAIIPTRNVGLIYETPMLHTVALPSINAPLRESLQIFINEGNSV